MKDAFNKAGIKTNNTSDEQKNNQKSYDNKDNKGNKGYSGHKNNGSYNNGSGKNYNNRSNRSISDGYVGAPYNFVSIPRKVFNYKEENNRIPTHNQMDKELLSGSIKYTVKAHTPIMVGSGIKGNDVITFYRNSKGQYAIPGSTMRGLIRSNMQICSFSSFSEDIADYMLMFRNVASGADKKLYNSLLGNKSIQNNGKTMSVLKNVKAGYIAKEKDSYVIYNTCDDRDNSDDMNYYVISEKYINEHENMFSYLYSKEFGNKLQYEKGTVFNLSTDKNGRRHYKPRHQSMFNGAQGGSYHPFYAEISFEIKNNRISSIDAPGKLSKKGFLMGTGPMHEKKILYVIPKIDKSSEPLVIDKASEDAYQIDYNARLNNLGVNKDFYGLPKDNEVRPIFYIYLDAKLYFGYTPRLRLFYNHSIKYGLKQAGSDLDYGKALFGYIGEKDSYKSRLSFVDAYTENGKEMSDVRYTLSSPKPTSYLDYLKQEGGKAKTYNDDFELRGVKQYWNINQTRNMNINDNNQKVSTRFKPLESGTEFSGVIRFKNLTKDELGLLLYCMELKEEANHNIGMGRAYGYGRVKISCTSIQLFNLDKAYQIDVESFMNPFVNVTDKKQEYIDTYMAAIDKWISANYPGKKFSEISTISEFISMKTEIMKEDLTRYMSIDAREYQNRIKDRIPLPTVDEMIKTNRK